MSIWKFSIRIPKKVQTSIPFSPFLPLHKGWEKNTPIYYATYFQNSNKFENLNTRNYIQYKFWSKKYENFIKGNSVKISNQNHLKHHIGHNRNQNHLKHHIGHNRNQHITSSLKTGRTDNIETKHSLFIASPLVQHGDHGIRHGCC